MQVNSDASALIKLLQTVTKKKGQYEIRARNDLRLFENKDERETLLQKQVEYLEKKPIQMEVGTPIPPLELPLSPATSEDVHTMSPKNVATPTLYHFLTEKRRAFNMERGEPCSLGSGRNWNTTIPTIEQPLNHARCEHMIASLQEYNKELRRAVIEENELRIYDQKMYNEVLERVYHFVEELQKQKEIPINIDSDVFPQWLLEQAVDAEKSKEDNLASVNKTQVNEHADKNLSNRDFKLNPCFNLSEVKNCVNNEKKLPEIAVTKHIIELQYRLKDVEKLLEKKVRDNYALKLKNMSYRENFFKTGRKYVAKYRNAYKCMLRCYGRQRHAIKQMQNKYRVLFNKSSRLANECQILRSNEQETLLTLRDYEIQIKALEELLATESSVTLKGRLSAANEVMTKQRKQIEELQQHLEILQKQLENVRCRLNRAETLNARRQSTMENYKRQTQDSQERLEAVLLKKKNVTLGASELRENMISAKVQIIELKKLNKDLQVENSNYKYALNDLTERTKVELIEMCDSVDDIKRDSQAVEGSLRDKLSRLRQQHTNSIKLASDKIMTANLKIQELYRSIEQFLTLLSEYHSENMNSLGGDKGAMAEAVKVASAILNISPTQLKNLINKQSNCEVQELEKWIDKSKVLIQKDNFSQPLGQFLFDTAKMKFL